MCHGSHCLMWTLCTFCHGVYCGTFYLASVTVVCCGYYLSPWCPVLLAVNPLPCTVVAGVCVVHCLLCTVEVIGFCCGPSNWHHGSVYCLSVEPCTLVVIYDFVDPLPCSVAVTIVCCGPFTVCLGGPWHIWCTLLPCIVVVIGVCCSSHLEPWGITGVNCRPFMSTLSSTVITSLARKFLS